MVEEWCYPTGDQMAACYALVHYQKTTTGEGGTNAGGTTADSKSSQVKEGSETKYKVTHDSYTRLVSVSLGLTYLMSCVLIGPE